MTTPVYKQTDGSSLTFTPVNIQKSHKTLGSLIKGYSEHYYFCFPFVMECQRSAANSGHNITDFKTDKQASSAIEHLGSKHDTWV